MKHLREIIENVKGQDVHGVSFDKFKSDVGSGKPLDYDWVHSNAQKNLTGDTSHIGQDHMKSIQNWTTPAYRGINTVARGGEGNSSSKRDAENLSHAVNGHALPNSTHVYRGIHSPHSDHLNTLSKGDTFHIKGFASTTLDPIRATHFAKGRDILHMTLPKGQKALYVSHPHLNSWESEREMLLPHNSHFKYLGHTDMETPEFHYTGEPTGEKKMLRFHHVEVIPHSTHSLQIDK